MQKFLFSCFISIVFIGACHNKAIKESSKNSNTIESQSFFPVTDFLLGQLNEIDSLPVTPVKITITNNKVDSVWLKKKDIRIFAQPFLYPVIDSVSLKPFFTEKSFLDQTINAITLSYDLKSKLPDSINLTHWDVYIDPQSNTIQRIYMVKEHLNITTQLTWKANKWCSIRTITQRPKMLPEIKEEIMKWEFEE